MIPLTFVGESKAVKQMRHLGQMLDEIEVTCLPANLPHAIEVNLAKLSRSKMRSRLYIALPTGVKAVTAADVTVATVARPLTEDEIKRMNNRAWRYLNRKDGAGRKEVVEKAATEAVARRRRKRNNVPTN
jgi:hypothetical protein